MGDLVTFEVAKKLKEKGFMQKVVYYYNEKGKVNVYKSYTIGNIEHSWLDFRTNKNMCESSPWCDAPTISQVLKWLREKKGWIIVVRLYSTNGWYWFIQDKNGELKSSHLASCDDCFATYEQAALAGIEYVLDNII